MLRKFLYCILFCLIYSSISAQSHSIIKDDPMTLNNDTGTKVFTPRSLDSDFSDAAEAVKTLTMHGSVAFGYYFTTLYFGTPAQRQTVIVDTGSTITTIPCRECGSSCGVSHLSDYFNPGQSNSFQEMTCRESFGNYICQNCNDICSFDIRYSEGSSYHGRFKKDYVSFEDPDEGKDNSNSTNHTSLRGSSEPNNRRLDETETDVPDTRMFMPFGCTLRETNLFLTQEADGILGLGVDTNNPHTPPNVFDYLHMTNSSISNAFSICMGPVGGYIGVGGFNSTYHAPDEMVQYVPYDGSNGQYRVHWKSVKFEGETLNIEERVLNEDRGAYIDSGTTLVYTTHFIARTINDALANFCKKEGNCGGNVKEDICWIYDPEKYPTVEDFLATFGTFTFQFGKDGESEYEWRPEDYLFHYSPSTNYYCLGLERIGGKKTLFGGAFMKNHDVLFDKSNKRIGFIRSNCSGDYSLDSYPKSVHSSSEEYIAVKDTIRFLLITLIALGLLFLCINLLVGYVRSRRLRNKFTSVELGLSVDSHHDEVLESSESDFRAFTGADSQRFQRASEEYAV